MQVLYTMCVPGTHRDQKKMKDPLELELQVIMGHLVGAKNWREVPLEEEPELLTTKPSLQPQGPSFKMKPT